MEINKHIAEKDSSIQIKFSALKKEFQNEFFLPDTVSSSQNPTATNINSSTVHCGTFIAGVFNCHLPRKFTLFNQQT